MFASEFIAGHRVEPDVNLLCRNSNSPCQMNDPLISDTESLQQADAGSGEVSLDQFKKEPIQLDKGCVLELWHPVNLPWFRPNQVTRTVADPVVIRPGDVVFEIGAGIGSMTLLFLQKFPGLKHLYSVEVVPQQADAARLNIREHGFREQATVFEGSLFSPLEGRANVIVGDCSGMTAIGRELEWYPPEPEDIGGIPLGGADGTEVTLPFLEQSQRHLMPGGTVYFPVIPNFSDGDKILQAAREIYGAAQVEPAAEARKIPLTQRQLEIIDQSEIKTFRPIERNSTGTRGRWVCEVWKATHNDRT